MLTRRCASSCERRDGAPVAHESAQSQHVVSTAPYDSAISQWTVIRVQHATTGLIILECVLLLVIKHMPQQCKGALRAPDYGDRRKRALERGECSSNTHWQQWTYPNLVYSTLVNLPYMVSIIPLYGTRIRPEVFGAPRPEGAKAK